MKIIPQNGYMMVEMVGRGDYTTKAGILLKVAGQDKPNIDEVTRFLVLAIDPNPVKVCRTSFAEATSKQYPYVVDQVVCAQGLMCKEIAKRNPEDKDEKQRFYLRWEDVISVIEEETKDAN